MIELIILFPLIASVICLLLKKRPDTAETVAILGIAASLISLILTVSPVNLSTTPVAGLFGYLYLDSLSVVFVAIAIVVALFAAIYSRGYMREEAAEGTFERNRISKYNAFLLLFLSSVLFVSMASNLLMIWVFMETTTLTSVFLISFYNKKESVEAAWKYFIVCSLGITLALVGLLILEYGMQQAGVAPSFAWWDVIANASKINVLFLKIALAFVIVGYGTKMGLAPLHIWLPDAHSQAPTPISALLSGVLLNTALYGILRLYPVGVQVPAIGSFISTLLIAFGLLSLALASLRLYYQENYKRLLAYSSVENMGIIAIALGVGGPLGVFAAIFLIVSHSLVKPLAFFMWGIINHGYGAKEISYMGGVAQTIPSIGLPFILANMGVAGGFPFGTFIAEIILIAAALAGQHYIVLAFLVVFATISFGTLLLKSSQIVYGKVAGALHRYSPNRVTLICVWALFALAVFLGIIAPQLLFGAISSAASVLLGG